MKDKITIKNDKGLTKDYDILFTFESKEEHKVFVVYTDYKKDSNGDILTYSSFYDNDDPLKKLNEVVDKNEIDYINKAIKSIEYNIKNEN